MKTPIDYSNLIPGDVWGTTRVDLLGCIIRLTEVWRSTKNAIASARAMFDVRVPSHILLTCEEHDLYYGMEMTWPEIRHVDLHDYDGRFGRSRTVFRARIPQIASFYHGSNYGIVNQWILKCHERNVKYDWKGLLEFWGIAEDEKSKWYCSEFFREMLRHFNVGFPGPWEDSVDPLDVYRYCTAHQLII